MKCPECGYKEFDRIDIDIGQARQIVDHCLSCDSCFLKGKYKGKLQSYLDWKWVEKDG